MRTLYIVLFSMLFVACGNKKEGDNTAYLPSSQGKLNSISVVIDNDLWEGSIGEEIRSIFAAPINGLPNEEPLFELRQVPPQVFDGFAKRSRIVLKVEQDNGKSGLEVESNTYAKPQTVAVVSGDTDEAIIASLKDGKAKIIDAFNKEEVSEKLRLINKSLLKDERIEAQLGFNVKIPSAYKIEKSEDNFFWLRKGLDKYKTIDLMFYEVPMENIAKGDSTVIDIVNIRNEITKTKIPGEDGIFMMVQEAYAPAMFKTIIDNKPAYEVRGLWYMKGHTMAGPFITYAIEDQVNKRYLIADGYVYAPSLSKSEYIFELESIIKSITIN